MIDFTKISGFQWDAGISRKRESKHGVSMAEAEQVFFNTPLLVLEDTAHSAQAVRIHALGKTDGGRALHISFTLRNGGSVIRVISARTMHRKERAIYEQSN